MTPADRAALQDAVTQQIKSMLEVWADPPMLADLDDFLQELLLRRSHLERDNCRAR